MQRRTLLRPDWDGRMLFTSQFGVASHDDMVPEDVYDSISTLSFSQKLVVQVKAPGIGPEVLLEWARAELQEANASTQDRNASERKAFCAAILSKTAVECLLDWYLDSSFLGYTLRHAAGTEEKLDALDAEGLLSIGKSLFRDIVFTPRNRAIHSCEKVDPKAAQHAYELARMFVMNSQNTPGQSIVYYGPLDLARDGDVDRLVGTPNINPILLKGGRLYFGGLGDVGLHGVFLTREGTPTISVLESLGDGMLAVRRARLSAFSPELLRKCLGILSAGPLVEHVVNDTERDYLVGSLTSIVNYR